MSDPVHVLESRIGNLRKYLPDAKLNLYAMTDRSFSTFCVVGIATCAEQMLDLCHKVGLRDWTLGNTNCRSIIRNLNEEGPQLLTVVELKHDDRHIRHEAQPALAPMPGNSANERTRKRAARRKRAQDRARQQHAADRLDSFEEPSESGQESSMTASPENQTAPLS